MATPTLSTISQNVLTPTPSHQRLRRFFGADYRIGYLFIAPMVLVVVGFIAYPFLYAVFLSFTRTRVGTPSVFNGLDNYIQLAKDSVFRQTVGNTIFFTATSVAVKLVIGMAMALTLHGHIKGRSLWAGILLIPWVAPTIVTVLNWLWMFDFNLGALNYLARTFGLSKTGINWLGQRDTAMLSIILVNVWRGFPFFGVTLLAALKTVPHELLEAATIDGAGVVQRFRHVTLPSVRKVLLVVTLLSTIWTFNDFQIVYILTGGGPANSTQVVGTLTWDIAFNAQQLGQAVTVSIYIMPILILMIWVLTRYLRKDSASG